MEYCENLTFSKHRGHKPEGVHISMWNSNPGQYLNDWVNAMGDRGGRKEPNQSQQQKISVLRRTSL